MNVLAMIIIRYQYWNKWKTNYNEIILDFITNLTGYNVSIVLKLKQEMSQSRISEFRFLWIIYYVDIMYKKQRSDSLKWCVTSFCGHQDLESP